MLELNKNFVIKTDEFLHSDEIKEGLGENFAAFEAIVKAAIGINDVLVLAQIIGILLPGLDMHTYSLVKELVNDPTTMKVCLSNSVVIE